MKEGFFSSVLQLKWSVGTARPSVGPGEMAFGVANGQLRASENSATHRQVRRSARNLRSLSGLTTADRPVTRCA